jgi:hypothetical protein
MEYLKIINTLMQIIVALIVISQSGILPKRKVSLPAEKPKNRLAQAQKIPANGSRKIGIFRKPWVVLLVALLCMAYVLPEVFSPGELTRMALYKIIMGIGLFFFLLIQSSISNIIEVIFKFKSADLGLIKSFSKEFKKGDNP